MELKRYVLTKGNLIIEDTLHKNCYVNKYGYAVYGMIGDMLDLKDESMKVVRSSDNILDLVEVGDLVGIQTTGNSQLELEGFKGLEISQIITITNRERIKGIIGNRFYFNGGARNGDEVIAIYKLQSNGDYKRYEVQK